MKSILLVFPHQLFSDHPGFNYDIESVALIEDTLFFGDKQYPIKFHKQKLVLHRASMKSYEALLKERDKKTDYFEYENDKSNLNTIFVHYKKQSYKKMIVCEVVDFTLEKRLKKLATQHEIELEILTTPMFFNTPQINQDWAGEKKKLLMADFYKQQRTRLDILMDGDEPKGGQWSYDEANRKKVPKTKIKDLPKLEFPEENKYIKEAKEYVVQNFSDNYGLVDKFYYPVNHDQAEAWLETFLEQRFNEFGPYEDAIVEGENWLYHSILTPMLNIGLLTPKQIIEAALKYGEENEVSLASQEGFVRQIIGWREFMRLSYEKYGVTMRTTNHWQHHNKIPKSFYDGTTGIDPIDDAIKRTVKTGYCHHIERLMVLGGFMFLCEFDPDEIYKWFMEMFIDSYDWVMVPNVYAMSQNADGGLITTKPYFSGSNYVKKMSHYKTGDWADTWDALYWNWILKNAEDLKKNHRWSMMVAMANKMDDEKKANYKKLSKNFMSKISG